VKPKIELTSQSRANWNLALDWPNRSRAIVQQFPSTVARAVLQGLEQSIPSEFSELRDSLEIVRIGGLPDSAAGVLVRARMKGQQIQPAEEPSTLIYVTAKSSLMVKVPKEIRLLEEHSPWTVDTLPFQPDKTRADVVFRKVNPRAVVQTRRLRRRDRPIWRRKMNELGMREVRKDLRLTRTRQMKGIPDRAFESIRLEFGLGGTAPTPHWRPTILKLALRGLAGMIRRQRQFSMTMTRPNYQAWKAWHSREVRKRVPIGEARKYTAFQKKLGIRAKR
jgi:hypothetical protein